MTLEVHAEVKPSLSRVEMKRLADRVVELVAALPRKSVARATHASAILEYLTVRGGQDWTLDAADFVNWRNELDAAHKHRLGTRGLKPGSVRAYVSVANLLLAKACSDLNLDRTVFRGLAGTDGRWRLGAAKASEDRTRVPVPRASETSDRGVSALAGAVDGVWRLPPDFQPRVGPLTEVMRSLAGKAKAKPSELVPALIACLANIDGAIRPLRPGPCLSDYQAAARKMTEDPDSYRVIYEVIHNRIEILGYVSLWRTSSGDGHHILAAAQNTGNVPEGVNGGVSHAVLRPKRSNLPGYEAVITAVRVHPLLRRAGRPLEDGTPPHRRFIRKAIEGLLIDEAKRRVFYTRVYFQLCHEDDSEYFAKPHIRPATEFVRAPRSLNGEHDAAVCMTLHPWRFARGVFKDLAKAYAPLRSKSGASTAKNRRRGKTNQPPLASA